MNDMMTALYANVVARANAAARRDEKGQGTLEYVGIAVVASILVAAVVDALANGSAITSAIQAEIQEIVSQGG